MFTDVGFHLKSEFKKILCSQMLIFTLVLDSQKYCVHQFVLLWLLYILSILSLEVCKSLLEILENTACYTGILLAPAKGFGQGLKKELIMLFWSILGHFRCRIVNLGTCCSNLIHNNKNKNQKQKNSKNKKSLKKI